MRNLSQEKEDRRRQRSGFRNDLSGARGGLDVAGLRELARRNPNEFMARCEDLISARKLRMGMISDLKAFANAFLDIPVRTKADLPGLGQRMITTSAFPLLMGSMAVAELNEAYEAVPTIGEELVREMDSNKKFTHVVKITSLVHGKLDTPEGKEFPLISAGEQFSTIGHKRKGFQIACTAEVLEENDIGQLADQIDQGGEFAAEVVEEQTLSRVFDQNGSAASPGLPYVYQPQGVGTALYHTSANAQNPNGTRITNTPLTSSDSLEAARANLASRLNTRGKRIAIRWSETKLVVPDALLGTALKILNSELEPGVLNEANNWGPKGQYRPKVVSSPKIDDITTSAWLLGAMQRQFRRKRKLNIETVTVANNPMEFLRYREAWRMRVAWDIEVGAIDDVYVVQALAGTTAPTAGTDL